jgi:hypothetical protein
MKRDWDLIRKILIAAEEKEPGKHLGNDEIKDYDPQLVATHMDLLHDAGYIDARFVRSTSLSAIVLKVTYSGHDLLDTMRSESAWTGIKNMAKSKGLELTFEVVKQIGKFVINKVIQGESIPGIS